MGTLAAIGATPFGGRPSGFPWVPSIHIDGTQFTTAQILSGFPGARDDATGPSNKTWLAANTTSNLTGGSLWSAVIKGTSAKLVVNRSGGGGFSTPQAVFASVDGGAFTFIAEDTLATTEKGFFTLFTGLSDAEHYVVVRFGSSYGTTSLFFNDDHTDALTLTGTGTYIELCNQWAYAGVASSHSVVDGMTKPSTANFTPARTMLSIYSSVSNCASARIRGRFRSIQVAQSGGSAELPFSAVFVSKDGAAPTRETFVSKDDAYTYRITGLDESLSTYSVWTNYIGNGAIAMFAISGDADHVDVGSKKRIHQFGDSITRGQESGNAYIHGEVDLMLVAASMGYVATTVGIGGQTIAELEAAMDTYLTAFNSVTSDDVAILAIGRNNIVNAPRIDATVKASYDNIIDKLVAKGYGKVICRGVLPNAGHTDTWDDADQNPALEDVVDTIANPAVVFLDVSTCPVYTADGPGTHPNTAGYATIAAYVEPLYRTILGL